MDNPLRNINKLSRLAQAQGHKLSYLAKAQSAREVAITMIVLIVASVLIFFLGLLFLSVTLRGHVVSVADYKIFELQSGSYTTTASAQGNVQPAKTAVNLPEVNGTVEEVKVKEGDTVKKGQLVVVLHSDEIESELASARSAYESAQSQESQAQSRYSAARSELAAAKAAKEAAEAAATPSEPTTPDEGSGEGGEGEGSGETGEGGETGGDSGEASAAVFAATPRTVAVDPSYDAAIEEAQGKVNSAASALNSAESETSSARSWYRSMQGRQEALSVKAEAAGTVTDLKATVGASVSDVRGQGAAMQIANPKKLVVVCSVPESETDAMSRGQDATVTGIAADNAETPATVSKIATVPNGNTAPDGGACFDVTLELSTEQKLSQGTEVSATIQLQDYGMVFYVPKHAVLEEGDKTYIEMIYDDNSSAKHEVQVIATADDGQKIIRGNALSNGAKIRADLAS